VKPKIIIWDIETGYNVVNIFDLLISSKYIPYSQIAQERYIICASFKELGKDKITTLSISNYPEFSEDPSNDKGLVKDILDYLKDADAIIAHNGDRFDSKRLNTRAVYWGFDPLPNIITIDTLKIAKNHFNFNSNRLDYLGKFLKVGEKIKVDMLPLWTGALNGSKASIREIVKYNRQDVNLLEKVYQKLAPYAPAKLNRALFTDGLCCPLCGSEAAIKDGTRLSRTGLYQRYRCKDCGHPYQGTKTIKQVSLASK
jgi:DNA polymerase elongation subunit (family B)